MLEDVVIPTENSQQIKLNRQINKEYFRTG